MYNILICDDQPDIVTALRIYLKPEGYGLYEAADGQQVLEVLLCVIAAEGWCFALAAQVKMRDFYWWHHSAVGWFGSSLCCPWQAGGWGLVCAVSCLQSFCRCPFTRVPINWDL